MRNVRISIIVPVYNAIEHVAESLSSIQSQTFKDWECICVDDGSSDESPDIVERFVANDARFRLIRQENLGPGGARNTGLDAARGEYFTFVDADDLLHPEILERLLDLATSRDVDLVVCDYLRFKSNDEFGKAVRNPELLAGKTDLHPAPLLPEMLDWRRFRVHPWGKLYLRARHGNVRFPHLFGPEDDCASFEFYGGSKRAVFSQMRLYGYRIVEEALTNSVAKYRNYIHGYAEAAIQCDTVSTKHGVGTDLKSQLVMKYVMEIFGLLYEMSTDPRIPKSEKRHLLTLARDGLKKIRRCVAGRYRTILPVNYIAYTAVCLRSLWLLRLWQWIKYPLAWWFKKRRTSPRTSA